MDKAVLFRIKKESLDDWRAWCKEIATTSLSEAELSLAEERVFQEVTFCFSINGEWYGLGFIDGEGLPANPDREINRRHKEMKKKCIEYLSEAEVLYNVHNNK